MNNRLNSLKSGLFSLLVIACLFLLQATAVTPALASYVKTQPTILCGQIEEQQSIAKQFIQSLINTNHVTGWETITPGIPQINYNQDNIPSNFKVPVLVDSKDQGYILISASTCQVFEFAQTVSPYARGTTRSTRVEPNTDFVYSKGFDVFGENTPYLSALATSATLNVPYVDQDFAQGSPVLYPADGHRYWTWCGPSSVAMVVSYFGIETRDVFNNKAPTQEIASQIAPGIEGTYWTYINSTTIGLIQYLNNHGIAASLQTNPSFADIKQSIDSGFPVIMGTSSIAGASHILVVKGYRDPNIVIVNDPFGDKFWADRNDVPWQTEPFSTPHAKGQGMEYIYGSELIGGNWAKITSAPTTNVTISGNAGIAGATLSYTDGTAKTVTADGGGSYTLTVPSNWSGAVTPSKSGYTISPASKSYSNLTTNQTAQDYTAIATPIFPQGWSVVSTTPNLTLWDVDALPGNHAKIAGGWCCNASISSIFDWSGNQWQAITHPGQYQLFTMDSVSDNEGWYGGQYGELLHYTNGSFQRINITANNIQDIDMISSQDGWAITSSEIFHFVNGNWQIDSNLGSVGLGALQMISASDGWAVGFGKIYHYQNGVWASVPSPTTDTITDIDMLSATDGWAVTSYGKILHYQNGSWGIQSATTNQLEGIDMLSETEGWAVGSDGGGNHGIILHYLNGQWNPVDNPATGAFLMDVKMISATEGWAVGGFNGIILRYNGASICSTVSEIPETECAALESLYNSTNGANWTNKTGWLQTNTPCSWYGVTCSGANVTSLSLGSNNLSGIIPIELGNLTRLQWLGLYNNQLNGSIPTQLGNLTNLMYLYLDGNQLSGSIPTQLGNLTQLYRLSLYNNQLNGSIPTQLGNLTQLQELFLYGNQLSSSIPTEFGNLTNLTKLNLSGNQLTGTIPPSLGNLSKLTYLVLSTNHLSGSIPWQLGNLSALQYLNLYQNQLSGSIPNSLGSLSQLIQLHLGENQLTGNIPPELGNLSNLAHLALFNNKLTGNIPPELGNLSNVTNFDLCVNQLTGTIPPEIGNLSKLNYLVLGRNQLSGGIPTWIGNLSNLTGVWLDNNLLTGSIPSSLGNLSHLTDLTLSYNHLSGNIPPELGNSTQLTKLWLDNNQMSGEIPVSFTHLTSLTDLTLSCGLASSNPAVINFINARLPGWQNRLCLPFVTLKSAGAQDGWILESSEKSNVGGTMNATATTFNLGDNAARMQYRAILSFITGTSLPDNAVITKVTLRLQKSAIVGGGNPVTAFQGILVDIKNGVFGTAALQITDFQTAASKTVGPFKPTPISNWYTLDLTGAKTSINKLATGSGLTQIRLRFKVDDNNNALANYLSLFSGNAPAASRPQLIIQYYMP